MVPDAEALAIIVILAGVVTEGCPFSLTDAASFPRQCYNADEALLLQYTRNPDDFLIHTCSRTAGPPALLLRTSAHKRRASPPKGTAL